MYRSERGVMPDRPTLLRQSPIRLSPQHRVAGNVRGALALRWMKAADLAELLDLSYPTALSRWHGRTGYRVDELERLSRFFGESIDWLFREQ